MIWSLFRILAFVALTAALAYAGGLLLESDGQLRVTAMGTELTLGPMQAAVVAVLLVVLIWILMRLSGLLIAIFRFINGDETAISRYFDRNRERRGFEALADGMMALASGEGRLAMAKAARAEKFLGRPELTNLLTAQAAEMAGDRVRAEEVYRRLLQDDRTRFVGVRGIMKQKLEDGDTDTALELAERAFALKPRHDETADLLLRLQAGKKDWTGARRTLGAKLRSGALPRDVHRRRDAVLALSEAGGGVGVPRSREAVMEANRLSPDLVPAAVAAARVLIDEGSLRQAAKVVRRAWDGGPHPELAAAFAAISPKETPSERLKRFAPLIKVHPDDPEVRMLLAELNIAAEDFVAARGALGDLAETRPTARTLALMAAIERGAGADDRVVRGYLAKALSSPRGPEWVCDNCQAVQSQWSPVCGNCEGLDTLSWRQSQRGDDGAGQGTELVPLIVGAHDKPDDPDIAENDPGAEEIEVSDGVPVDEAQPSDFVPDEEVAESR